MTDRTIFFAETVQRSLPSFVLLALPTVARAQSLFDSLHFRSIGPAVTGGRVHDIEVDPKDASTIYVATATGGIWKTTNKGTTWSPIFDGQPENRFGALAIFPVRGGIARGFHER